MYAAGNCKLKPSIDAELMQLISIKFDLMICYIIIIPWGLLILIVCIYYYIVRFKFFNFSVSFE